MSKPADLKGDRRRRSADHAHPRRRGDRVRDPLHVGPGRSRYVNVVESDRLRRTSAFGGRAETSWAEPYVAEPQQQLFSASRDWKSEFFERWKFFSLRVDSAKHDDCRAYNRKKACSSAPPFKACDGYPATREMSSAVL